MVVSVLLLMGAVASLIAVPVYGLMGFDRSLVLYGFVSAGILFGLGAIFFVTGFLWLGGIALCRALLSHLSQLISYPVTSLVAAFFRS
jgi:hypothetical protein